MTNNTVTWLKMLYIQDQFKNDKRNLYEKLSSVFYGGHFTGFGDGFRSRLVFVGLFCPLYI